MTMYAFLFVLVPLATVTAWALVRDRKRRHRRHSHAPDIQSRIRTARQSAQERAAKWMLRASLTMAGGLTDALADAWRNGTCLAPEGRPAPQPGQAAGSGEVRGEQPDLGSCARGSGAGRVVHLRLRRRAGYGGSGGNP